MDECTIDAIKNTIFGLRDEERIELLVDNCELVSAILDGSSHEQPNTIVCNIFVNLSRNQVCRLRDGFTNDALVQAVVAGVARTLETKGYKVWSSARGDLKVSRDPENPVFEVDGQQRSHDIQRALNVRSGVDIDTSESTWQFHPIGEIRSVYMQKFGAPRQGLANPFSLGYFELKKCLNGEYIRGLEEYSHVWIVFVFDKNSGGASKATTKPPRADGAKYGALATRTPHRPNPIGLSVAEIIKVDTRNRRVYLRGVDIIDRTPVLDIKPYHPLDSIAVPTSPEWVSATASTSLSCLVSKKALDQFMALFKLQTTDLPAFVVDDGSDQYSIATPGLCDGKTQTSRYQGKLQHCQSPWQYLQLCAFTMSTDPRPSYLRAEERIYTVSLDGYDVSASFDETTVTLIWFQPVTRQV